MSGEADDSERTEEPSPEKLRRAREEGNIARSKDAGAVAATVACLLLLSALGSSAFAGYRGFAEQCFAHVSTAGTGGLKAALGNTGLALIYAMLPVAFAAAVAGTLIGMAEVGIQFNTQLLEPKWSRIDPLSKLGQLFSPSHGGITSVLTLLRIAVTFYVSYSVLKGELPALLRLPRAPLEQSVLVVLAICAKVAFWSVLALAVLSLLDYGYSYFKIHRSLRMTRQELKDELQQQEGDQKVKGKIRARARELAKRGIISEVKRADVIVANPTHVAVALRYRPEEGAPIVTAKGLDEVAQYIKKIARDHEIPVVESKALARALHAQVKVGRRIPVELYQAVAELLAYVYRIKKRGLRA